MVPGLVADPSYRTKIHPALTRFADQDCTMRAYLVAYMGALALLAIAGIYLFDQSPVAEATSLPPVRFI